MNKTRPRQPITPTRNVTITHQDAAFIRSLLRSMADDLGRGHPIGREIRRVAGRVRASS